MSKSKAKNKKEKKVRSAGEKKLIRNFMIAGAAVALLGILLSILTYVDVI